LELGVRIMTNKENELNKPLIVLTMAYVLLSELHGSRIYSFQSIKSFGGGITAYVILLILMPILNI